MTRRILTLNVFITTLILLVKCGYCRDFEREFTIRINPGTEECFYQDIEAEEALDIEYQVNS